MQEEVENRTVNLAISTTKLSARITLRLALWGIRKLKRRRPKPNGIFRREAGRPYGSWSVRIRASPTSTLQEQT